MSQAVTVVPKATHFFKAMRRLILDTEQVEINAAAGALIDALRAADLGAVQPRTLAAYERLAAKLGV